MLVFLGTLVAACDGSQSENGDLTVNWKISGLNVCRAFLPEDEYAQSEITFETVEINIFKAADPDVAVQEPVVVPCDTYSYKFSRLSGGRYIVTVDASGKYDGEKLPFFSGSETALVPDKESGDSVTVPLMLGSAGVQITWKFESGLTCGVKKAGEVASVAVSFAGEEIEVPCGEGMVKLEDLEPGTDYLLTGEALDDGGEVLYDYSSKGDNIELLPGQNLKLELLFK
jgi:hypothetical protein